MRHGIGSVILRYGCALASIALAIWVRLLLDPLLGDQFPFPVLFFAVLLTAWYGGFAPAMAAVVAGGLAADYFLLPPRGEFTLAGPDQMIGLGLYLASSTGIALLGGALRKANDVLETRVRDRGAELANASDALRASEERLRLLIEGAKDYAIYMLDPRGNIVTWNSGAERLMGYAASDVIGGNFSRFFTAEDVAAGLPQRVLDEARDTGRCEEQGWRVRRDGSRFWANGVMAAFAQDGKVHGFSKVVRDVTEQRQSDQLRRSVLENTLDGIVSADEHGIIHSANRACERLFGYPASELVGQNVKMLMPEPLRSAHDQYLADYLRTDQAKIIGSARTVKGRRKDGSVFPVELAVSAFLIDGRRHFTGIMRDLTEREKLEEQLRRSQKMEAIGQLTGGIAHDFNNLLAVVIGNLDLLKDRTAADAQVNALVESAVNASLRGAQLTQQLLAFARRQTLDARVIDINARAAATMQLLRPILGAQIDIRLVLAADLPPALVDPTQFETALINLAINARDAMGRGGHLTIETASRRVDDYDAGGNEDIAAGDYVMLAVSDDGIGMPADVLARVFEPFFTTKPPDQGTGLGLSMVYGFAHQSGGHVKIYSEPGHGTTVRLYLPRAAGPVAAESAPATAVSKAKAGECILVVEDNPAVREAVVLQLDHLGYSVIAATNGASAIEHIRRGDPIDLLFTDMVMPGGMSGDELARAALLLRPGLKVLFTSGYASEPRQHDDDNVSAARSLLRKPYRRAELAGKLRAALDAKA